MSTLWLIEDSVEQRAHLKSLLTKMGHTVDAFENVNDLLERINKENLPSPEAVVMDLALRGTSNGFQAAEKLRQLRPELGAGKFCFISGWKKQFAPIKPPEFKDPKIIDKANWQIDELAEELDRAIHSKEAA